MQKGKTGGAVLPEEKAFRTFLKKKGLSFTRQREKVLHAVFDNHDHFDAEEMAVQLGKTGERVSRATVYRTIQHLVEAGLIGRLDLGDGRGRYEHILGHEHHEHLHCQKCGTLLEFLDPELEERILLIARKNGFSLLGHRVKILGHCKKCR